MSKTDQRDNPEQVNPAFDEFAEDYSKLLADPLRDGFGEERFFHERKMLLIREYFDRRRLDARSSTWVDIGCGRGDLLRMGMSGFGQAIGCDVSAGMLGKCEGLEVRRQEHEEILPFPDRFADFATAVCVYHHLPLEKREGFTREAARILKPGGRFCIIEHNPLNPVTRMIVKRSPVDVGVHLLRAGETCRLMEAQGLRIESVVHFLFFPESLYRKLGFVEKWLARVPIGGQYAVLAQAH